MISIIDYASFITAAISLTFGLILIVVHFIIPKTKNHPGQLILIQSCFQVYLDLNYIIISQDFNFLKDETTCYLFGLLLSSAMIQANYFFIIFAIEVYIEIKKKFIATHVNRCRVYYAISLLLFIFFSALGILSDVYGKETEFTCLYQNSSVFGFIVLYLYYFSNIGLIIIIVLSIRASNYKSRTIKKHLALVFVYAACLITSDVINLLYSGFNNNKSARISLILIAPIGFFVAVFRLWNKTLLREIKWKLCPKKMKLYYQNNKKYSLEKFLIDIQQESCTISEFFEVNSKKVSFIQNFIKILCSLSLRFYSQNLEYEVYPTHHNFYFTEDQFFQILRDLDANELEKRKFYLVYDPNLLLIEHMPEIFVKIREISTVDFKLESKNNWFLTTKSITKLKQLKNLEGGRSNAFLFTTTDQKFIIKTITQTDRNFFLKILPGYYERIVEKSRTKLVKIFGLFTLKPENIDFIVMENLVPDRENSVIFDLKGSTLKRKTQIPSFPIVNKVLKDINFIESQIKIKLENKDILYDLIEDINFLYEYHVVDYSLILGISQDLFGVEGKSISSELVKIGIIDIFQEYNLKKVSERKFKSILYDPLKISIAKPKMYHDRLIKFIQEEVFY
jgi:Phosphatidylinositol-4-phosphate 5-Kinase